MTKRTLLLPAVLMLAAAFAAECPAQMSGPRGPEDSGFWQEDGAPGGRPEMMPKMEGRAGGPGLRGRAFSAEEERYDADLIKKYDPDFSATLAELKKTAPMKYEVLMRLFGRQMMFARSDNDETMLREGVRAFYLEYETKELARGYENAADKDKEALRKKIGDSVSELFDLRQKVQEGRIRHMEKDLARLRQNLENRKVKKARIVEERVGQLTGEGYGW